jgi:hypothetical protein
VNEVRNIQAPLITGNSQLAKDLVTSQERLCSVVFVGKLSAEAMYLRAFTYTIWRTALAECQSTNGCMVLQHCFLFDSGKCLILK